MSTVAVNQGYGFQELRTLTRKYSTTALLVAGSLHAAGIGAYYGIQKLLEEDEPVYSVRIMKYSDLGPPPSITNSQAAPRFRCKHQQRVLRCVHLCRFRMQKSIPNKQLRRRQKWRKWTRYR